MLTHLWLARKLQVAAGFAIGHITVRRDRTMIWTWLRLSVIGFGTVRQALLHGRTKQVMFPNILTLPLGVNVEKSMRIVVYYEQQRVL